MAEGSTSQIRALDPTIRERLSSKLQQGIEGLGTDRYTARQHAQTFMGGENSQLPLGIGAADFVPFLGTTMAVEEGVHGLGDAYDAAKRGDPIDAIASTVGAAAGLIPGGYSTVKAAKSALKKIKTMELPKLKPIGSESVPKKQSLKEWAMAGGGVPKSHKDRSDVWHKRVQKYAAGGEVFNTTPDMSDGGEIIQDQSFAGGGSVKKIMKDAITSAAEKAGMKAPVTANKDLTNVQDYHTSLMDEVRRRTIEAKKEMDAFNYKYDKGQRVFTEHGAKNNLPPYTVVERSRHGNHLVWEGEPWQSKKIIDPETGKAKRTPYEPGYKVRRDGPEEGEFQEFILPETAIKGDVEMNKGGALKSAVKGALTELIKPASKTIEAPTIIIPSKLSNVKEAVRKREGDYGAKRVERASDEIPNLERLFQEDALRRAFAGGDNARALMTMNPADFEKYAAPLYIKTSVGPKMAELAKKGDISKGTVTTEEYLKYLRSLEDGFEDIPQLTVNKQEVGLPLMPYITAHEGRHRNRALAESGQPTSLIQFYPRAELREPFPRRSQEEYIDAIRKEMEMTGNMVRPEVYLHNILEKNVKRDPIELPDLYAKGGSVKKMAKDAIEGLVEGFQKIMPPKSKPAKGKQDILPAAEREANLQKFLENSKVKEKMYRGATPHFQLEGEPIFVSPTVRFAEKFPVGSTSPKIAVEKSQTVYPLHVNATNPFDYENTDDIQKVIYKISKSDPEQAEKLKNEFKYYLDMGDKFGTQSGNWGLIENTLVQDAIKKLGYDSFYVNEEGIKNLGVYNPNQVKTAIGNRGTYDIEDADITKAGGGKIVGNLGKIAKKLITDNVPTSKELMKSGQAVMSQTDAVSRLGNGEQLFAYHEMSSKPVPIYSVDDLKNWTPDQLLSLPKAEGSEVHMDRGGAAKKVTKNVLETGVKGIKRLLGAVDEVPAGVEPIIVRTPEERAVIEKFGQKQQQEKVRQKKVEKAARESAGKTEDEQVAKKLPEKAKGSSGKVDADVYRKMAKTQGDAAVIQAAENREHLKPTPGGYIGAPRTITTRQGLNAMRKDIDADFADSVQAVRLADPERLGTWYDRAKQGIAESTEPYQLPRTLEQHGVYSAGVSPESELAFALKHRNSRVAGEPEMAYRGEGMRTLDKAEAGNRPAKMGFKIGEYADKNDPRLPNEGLFGVNDFRRAQGMGYTDPQGNPWKAGVTETMHPFMDAETALQVQRANKAGTGGRSDWAGPHIQEVPWVYGKAQDLYGRGKKGRYAGDELEGIKSSLQDANNTARDYMYKHAASATHEAIPGASLGHVRQALDMSPEEKLAYSREGRWDMPSPESGMGDFPEVGAGNRDVIYGALGYRQLPSIEAQGFYRNKLGEVESNPMTIARPLMDFPTGGGGGRIADNSSKIMDASEQFRALMDANEAGGYNVPNTLKSVKGKNSMVFDTRGRNPNKLDEPSAGVVPTSEQLAKMDQLLGNYGFGVTGTNRGAVAFPYDPSMDPKVASDAFRKTSQAIEDIYPSSQEKAITSMGYVPGVGKRGPKGPLSTAPYSGEATSDMLRAFAELNPNVSKNLSESEAVRSRIRAKALRDSKKGGTRGDIQETRRFFSEADWPRAVEMIRQGISPAAALAALGYSASSMAGERDD